MCLCFRLKQEINKECERMPQPAAEEKFFSIR